MPFRALRESAGMYSWNVQSPLSRLRVLTVWAWAENSTHCELRFSVIVEEGAQFTPRREGASNSSWPVDLRSGEGRVTPEVQLR